MKFLDSLYTNAYGRLYHLVLKSPIKNPKTALLNSIKQPNEDTLFQKTNLYLAPLKRAIKKRKKPRPVQ